MLAAGVALVAGVFGNLYGQQNATVRPPAGTSAEATLNAFLATFAKTQPAWKKDILFVDSVARIPPGYQAGYSEPLRKWYIFRAKTWDDLTEAERLAVLKDPRMKSFIVSLRNARVFPSVTGAKQDIPTDKAVFPVDGADVTAPSGSSVVTVDGAEVVKRNGRYELKISAEELLRRRPIRAMIFE